MNLSKRVWEKGINRDETHFAKRIKSPLSCEGSRYEFAAKYGSGRNSAYEIGFGSESGSDFYDGPRRERLGFYRPMR
jgi:hypothetical protein